MATFALDKSPNIVLVSLDGLRSDVAYSGKLPALERIREQGIEFEHVVAPAPLTPISHASIFTGLFPPRHGIRHLFLEQLEEGVTTFPEVLQNHGYTTHAIVSCPGLHRWYGLAKGFDSYDDSLPPGPDGKDALYTVDVQARGRAFKRASKVLDKAIGVLDAVSEQRFFLFLHFFDAHWPYEPPEPFNTLHKENPYEGEIAYIDQMLGQFLEEITQRGLADNLMLIITADHGEDMAGLYPNDHGGKQLGHPEEEGHGCLLYDATQMVPLIVSFPDRYGQHRRVEHQVRLVDIAPTILDILGIDANLNFDGTSLVPHLNGAGKDLIGYCETHYPRENPQVLAKYPYLRNLQAVRVRQPGTEFKVIWHLESDVVEVYDLRQDPDERTNLLGSLNIVNGYDTNNSV